MVEVVPVQTFTVVSSLKGTEVIINLIPVSINKDSFDASISQITNVVYHDNMTSELRFIHVESSSQHINIHSSVKVGGGDKVLLILGSVSPNTSIVHLIVKDGHTVRHSFNLNHGFTSSCSIGYRSNRFDDETATLVPLTNKLLHLNELIESSRLIHTVNQPCDKSVKTIIRHESLTKLLIRYGQRIIQLAVNAMEHRGNSGEMPLKQGVLCSTRVIGLCLNNINVDFLNGLTHSQSAFLQDTERVRSHTAIKDNKTDTVNKSVHEFVGLRFKGKNSITNFVQVLRSSFGNSLLINSRSVIADNIQNIYAFFIRHNHTSFPR